MASLKGKELAFLPRTHDLKEFEAIGRAAKAAGFTHLFVSDLAERTDFRGEEVDSPWCEWSAVLPSLFKHVTPPGLEDAYPARNVKAQFDFLKAKYAICKKLGMRAAYYGTEPHWLNERVYAKHPGWRGSRADNSLRATGLYYSPNTDHPEVRAAYRAGMRMLCKACPGLDLFTFNTNDSGGFYPWDKRLFSGVNGPTGTQGKDMGLRVTEFLLDMRAGALDAGVDAHVFTNVYHWFNDDETHLVLRSLKPGIGVNGICPGEHQAECSLLGSGGSTYFVGPTLNKDNAVLDGLRGALNVKAGKARRYMGGGNSLDYFKAFTFGLTCEAPAHQRGWLELYHQLAVDMYGPEAADHVVDGWQTRDRAHTQAGAVGMPDAHTRLRWLTRPLVAHQELLMEDELSYWAPFAYYSRKAQPDKFLDYLNCSGYNMVENWAQASTICCGIDGVEGTLKAAAGHFQTAAAKAPNAKVRRALELEATRILVERSMALTVRHVLQVGTLIYLRDAANRTEPRVDSTRSNRPVMPKGDFGDEGLWYMQRALRWELDNIAELIPLLENAPEPIFFTAPHPSFEGPLILGGDVLAQVKRKQAIMIKHWRDVEIGYYKPTYGG
ncbi:MAG: hypothetical protein K8T26_08450 [Lentisphaerae bacterium]|nr:hypothetical protein [Lentisphaerota bacterium]